jgi:glyoxylase-like metal-dependent hydrolase (beta-lactamase superfamily II)
MRVKKLEDHIHLIDVETSGIKNFVASYILEGQQVAIVETGPTSSIPNLLSGLEKLRINLENVTHVAVSHIHLDHGGGVGTLIKHLPNAKVVVHPRGAPHLIDPRKLWEQSKAVLGKIADMYGEPEPVPEERIISTHDNMEFSMGNDLKLTVIETTGHASHHQSYYESASRGLFPGDAAGIYLNEINVIVPTTPAPFHMDIALASLDKLISLTPERLFYSHFGEANNAVEKLRFYRQQLLLWAKIAKEGIDNKESLDVISRRILESDESLTKAGELLKSHPILNDTVLTQSVYGIVDFVEKSGSAPT